MAAIAGAQLAAAPRTVKLSTDDQSTAQTADITAIKGGANILLIGSDTRVGQFDSDEDVEGARNDVTMLIHISQDHTQLTAVSFPRDLMVPIPACTNPETGTTTRRPRRRSSTRHSGTAASRAWWTPSRTSPG